MALEDIVRVNITAQTTAPTRPGFGTLLLFAFHTRWTSDLVREYSSLTEMVDDGFQTSDAAYKMAQKAFAQSPRPRRVKVGRRTRAFTQTIRLTPTVTVEGYVYKLKIGGEEVSYTVPAAATVASVCTGLTAAINGMANTADHTATDGTTHVTVTTNDDGVLLDYEDWVSGLLLRDMTADPGVEDDIADCVAEDDDWYGATLDSQSQAEVEAAAGDMEARTKLFGFNSSDSACFDPSSTTDVFASLAALNMGRTFGLFSASKLLNYSACAWMANRFPFDPGSDTWAFKTLRTVKVDKLSSGKVNAIMAKRASVYTEVAGVAITQGGKVFANEWIDVVRGIDWLRSEVMIRVFALLVNNQKIPYTDLGIDLVRSVIGGALQAAVNAGLLSSDPAPEVTAPAAQDVDPVTKAQRVLPDVKFSGTLAGAIHELEIEGTLSV